jgi:hypothetical protein
MTKGFGSPNSTARTIAGITRASSTRCSCSPKSAELAPPRAVSFKSAASTFCLCADSTASKSTRDTRARMISGLTLLRADENERDRRRFRSPRPPGRLDSMSLFVLINRLEIREAGRGLLRGATKRCHTPKVGFLYLRRRACQSTFLWSTNFDKAQNALYLFAFPRVELSTERIENPFLH